MSYVILTDNTTLVTVFSITDDKVRSRSVGPSSNAPNHCKGYFFILLDVFVILDAGIVIPDSIEMICSVMQAPHYAYELVQ